MGQLIYFPKKNLTKNDLLKIKNFSDSVDQVVLDGVREQMISPREIAGILSHRLGVLIRSIENKKNLWFICNKITKQQAEIE